MKVFISWSGERSGALAKAFHEWSSTVLHFIDPWLSQTDIQAGERWGIEIAKELELCKYGIICVTKDNLNSAWLLFEAGAIAKSMEDGKVIPFLLDVDVRELSGPLAQFQAKKVDKNSVKELVDSLNKAAGDQLNDSKINILFDALWPKFEEKINAIPKAEIVDKKTRSQNDILEELVSSVRSVDMKVREMALPEGVIYNISKRADYIVRDRSEELFHYIFEKDNDPIIVAMVASYFRNSIPWVYEIGMEAYRFVSRPRSTSSNRECAIKFLRVLEMIEHGMVEKFGVDRSSVMFIRKNAYPAMMLLQQAVQGPPMSIRRAGITSSKKNG